MTPHIDEFLSRARLVSTPYTQADIDAAEARVLARLHTPDPAPARPPRSPRGRADLPGGRPEPQEPLRSRRHPHHRPANPAHLPHPPTPRTPRRPRSRLHPPARRIRGERPLLVAVRRRSRRPRRLLLPLPPPPRPGRTRTRPLVARPDRTPPEHPLHRPAHHPQRPRHSDRRGPPGGRHRAQRGLHHGREPAAHRPAHPQRPQNRPAPVPATVGAVIDYAPAAVGYVDDFDLPLTDPDFTDHIRTLIATDTTPTRIRNRLQPRPKTSKPLIAASRRHRTWAWG